MKKIIRITIALLLVFSLMTACATTDTTAPADQTTTTAAEGTDNNETDETTDASTETYTIQVLVSPTNTISNTADTEVGKVIKEKFNIEFELIPYSGDMREKQNLMLAARDYNELQYMQREDIVISYIEADALIALDDYLDDMPNFTARFADIIPYWRLPGEGTLYKWETAIPRILESDIEVNDMLVRSDVVEAGGWEMPLSADEWVAFLKEAVQDATDVDGNPVVGVTLPMAEPWGLAGLVPILYEKSDTYSPVSNEGFTFNLKTQQFEDYFKNPYVKESLQFFNDLYREGVLDEECFTDTMAQTQDKLNKGQALVGYYVVWAAGGANAELTKSGFENMHYINLPIQSNTSVANGEKRQIRTETTRPFDSWGITDNAKDPARLLELVDWITTDEGQILWRSGVEGVHWNVEDGKRVATDALIQAVTDPEFNKTQGLGLNIGIPYFNMLAADGQPHGLSLDQEFIDTRQLSTRQQEAFAALGWTSSKSWYQENGYFAETGLASSIYIEPASDLGRTHQRMTELRTRYTANLIMADSDAAFEAVWDEAMAEYDRLNPEEVINEFNRLLEEMAVKLEEYKDK